MKISKLNYHIELPDNEIIAYNAYVGAESMIKTTKDSDIGQMLVASLNGKDVNSYINNLQPHKLDYLTKKGFIIRDRVDERSRIKRRYIQDMNDNVLGITIILTTSCNLRCVYCSQDHGDEFIDNATEDAIVKFIIAKISNYKSLHVTWFGGEPLLALNSIKRLTEKFKKLCKKSKKPYIADITTNGYLLNLEVFTELLNQNVFFFNITLDGLSETHDKQRICVEGGPSFEVINNNLEQISKIKNARFRVLIRVNISRDVLKNIDAFFKHYKDKFAHNSNFSLQLSNIYDWGGSYHSKNKQNIISDTEHEGIRKKSLDCNIKLNMDIYKNILNKGGTSCNVSKLGKYTFHCNKKVYKCSQFVDGIDTSIGYLNDKGLVLIDEDLENEWISNINICEKECFNILGCSYEKCPLERILNQQLNDTEKVNYNCNKTIADIDFCLRLLSNQAYRLG